MRPAQAIFKSAAAAAGVTVTLLGSVFDTNAGNHGVSLTPAVGDLIVIISCCSGTSIGCVGATDSQAGQYSQIIECERTTTTGQMKAYVRDTLITSAVSHTFTANHQGVDGGGCIVLAIKGMSIDGMLALRSWGAHNSIAAGTIAAPVLNRTPLNTNPVITADWTGSANSSGARAGYTAQFANTYASPSSYLTALSRNSGETSATITWGSAPGVGQHCSLAIEIAGPGSVSTEISPKLDANSGTLGSYTFVPFGITVNGGTPSSYNWYFTSATGGTFTINAGQGTNQATPRVTGVADPGSASAVLWCDVVVGGVTYSQRINSFLSYDRDSGGCVAVGVTVTLLDLEAND